MPDKTFEELKRYVRFGEADARALAAFQPAAQPHFERIAREFYERIREHEAAHDVFTGEEQIERLQRSMVVWMRRLLSGPYDAEYEKQTLAIGRIHVQVGLPQRYMFTAMALIRVALEDVAEASLTPTQSAATRRALTRLLDMELAMMLESYRFDSLAQARRRDEIEAERLRTDLARALRMYEIAVDVSLNIVVGIDEDGAIRLFNRAAQVLTGLSPEEVIGTPFDDLLVNDDARSSGWLASRFPLEAEESAAEDVLVKTRSGRLRDVRWKFARTAEDLPYNVRFFAVGSDLTDERLKIEQTQRNEKLAAVGTLAAGLAHEIRNPLNGAQLHLAYLRRALGSDTPLAEIVAAGDVVADEIRRLANLVSEFLDFARPTLLQKHRVVVHEVVERVIELTTPVATAAGVALSRDLPEQELAVYADRGKLEQVLLNIVQNAIEAMASTNGGEVLIRARRRPRDVVVEVHDEGPGLTAPDAPIFDAFFSTKPQGTGLGLAISQRIVSDHGGVLTVESGPGHTCFRFTVPIGVGDPWEGAAAE